MFTEIAIKRQRNHEYIENTVSVDAKFSAESEMSHRYPFSS